MRKLFVLLSLLTSKPSFSQKVFHLEATFKDSNYLRVGIGESMSRVSSDSGYIFSEKDSNCNIYSYYYNVSFTNAKTASGQVNVLFCKKGGDYKVTVDCNNNKNFKDDSTVILFADHIHDKYHFKIDPSKGNPQKHALYLNIALLTIKTTKQNGSSYTDVYLQLVHKNSIFGSFTLGKETYHVEAIPKYLNNGTGEATIGFSEPNRDIEKMDIAQNIIPHHLKNDTIISGRYRFIIDSVDFIHNTISLTAWPMTDKNYGYKISNRIRNYSLSYLNDTNKKISLKTLFKTSNYLLIDFWGSWCQPCLKNIPGLEELNKRSGRLSLNIIGLACERTNSPLPAINILKKLGAKYENFLINLNLRTEQRIINDLDIFAYPTYLLLDKNLKIVMRETNEEGLEKINFFLKAKS